MSGHNKLHQQLIKIILYCILSDLYSLPNIVRVVKSRRMRWAGHVSRMGEARVVHSVLVGKHEGKRPLGRPRRRWEDNIKMDLQEVGGGCGDRGLLVASRGQEIVSVVSRGDRSKCISCVPGLQPQVYELRPAVRKEMYQLRPRLSASCI